ncbi:MAG: PspC domain-containing protein [Paludibacteraceae bacterium]|nr:PspC domain-containing protein [Paludibacteraceae bacterium]
MENTPKRLYRSENKMIAGVCAGFAEYFNVDPTLVRLLYVAISIFTAGFPGLLLYIIMMILIPVKTQE